MLFDSNYFILHLYFDQFYVTMFVFPSVFHLFSVSLQLICNLFFWWWFFWLCSIRRNVLAFTSIIMTAVALYSHVDWWPCHVLWFSISSNIVWLANQNILDKVQGSHDHFNSFILETWLIFVTQNGFQSYFWKIDDKLQSCGIL